MTTTQTWAVLFVEDVTAELGLRRYSSFGIRGGSLLWVRSGQKRPSMKSSGVGGKADIAGNAGFEDRCCLISRRYNGTHKSAVLSHKRTNLCGTTQFKWHGCKGAGQLNRSPGYDARQASRALAFLAP